MQYVDNNQMISWVPMESMQSKESIFAKKITMKQLMLTLINLALFS
jgi:hypothetical protein